MMGRMGHEEPQGGYKLVLVPTGNIRTHSPRGAFPAYVTVSQDVMYEVIGDVAPDRQLRMSRVLYEQVEVVG
jgi:hypothetical protein